MGYRVIVIIAVLDVVVMVCYVGLVGYGVGGIYGYGARGSFIWWFG
jgi:hypothetical protein